MYVCALRLKIYRCLDNHTPLFFKTEANHPFHAG